MQKIILLVILHLGLSTGKVQALQLHYAGSNAIIIAAVEKANSILANPAFYAAIEKFASFDNTPYSGKQIADELRNYNKAVDITEKYKRHTRTTAWTLTEIKLNTAKLTRPQLKIVETLIHEVIHAVDYGLHRKFLYTHRDQKQEIPPVSAPYIIQTLVKDFFN